MLYVQQVQAGKPRQQCWDLIFLILAVAHMRRPGYYDTASGIDYSANSSQDSKTFTTLQDIYIYTYGGGHHYLVGGRRYYSRLEAIAIRNQPF